MSPIEQYQDVYNDIQGGSFQDWSDGSKSAFWNYVASQEANQHEIDMWNMQNEYNQPVKQMERMIKAGINPAAAYQQINSGNASSMPGTHKPTYAFDDQAYKIQKQQLKLQRVGTIMSSITSVLQGIGSIIGSAQGIQNMGLNYQNNYLNRLRYNALSSGMSPFLMNNQYIQDAGLNPDQLFKLGDDAYISSRDAVIFPELIAANSKIHRTNLQAWN